MSFTTWNSHSPCVKCFLNLPQGCVEFKWSCPFDLRPEAPVIEKENTSTISIEIDLFFLFYLSLNGAMIFAVINEVIILFHMNIRA